LVEIIRTLPEALEALPTWQLFCSTRVEVVKSYPRVDAVFIEVLNQSWIAIAVEAVTPFVRVDIKVPDFTHQGPALLFCVVHDALLLF
jgi:hypothetical protein